MKTRDQMLEMKVALEDEITRLPERDTFGDSNAESMKELEDWLSELEVVLSGGMISGDSELMMWLCGKNETFATDLGLK